MALPAGIITCVVTAGAPLDFAGVGGTITLNVVPVLGGNADRITWSATGQPLVNFSVTVTAESDQQAQVIIPVVDQPGFVDGTGNEAKNWSYRATVLFVGANRQAARWTKVFQAVTGQTQIDLDLVPDGSSVSPTSAPLEPVTSVNGQTGAVTIDESSGTNLTTEAQATTLLTAADGGQGLASDGSHFYWGKDNGSGVDGSIVKINPADGTVLATFPAPQHAAGVDYATSRGTLFATSSSTPTVTWEIDPATGTKLRSWDLSTIGYTSGNDTGGLVAWDDTDTGGNVIYQLTGSVAAQTFTINRVALADDGTFTDQGVFYDSGSIGTLQGMTCRAGDVYLLVDDLRQHSLRTVHRLRRDGDTLTEDVAWSYVTPAEAEGLTFHNGDLCYGDGAKKIWTAPLYVPNPSPIVTSSAFIIGDSGVVGGGSAEVMLRIARTQAGHCAQQIDASTGKDPFIYFSESGTGKFDIRSSAGSGQFQIRAYPSGQAVFAVANAGDRIMLGGLPIIKGSGSPLGVVTAPPGALYLNTSGGAGATLWVKESGTDATGWAAK